MAVHLQGFMRSRRRIASDDFAGKAVRRAYGRWSEKHQNDPFLGILSHFTGEI
jgi:hypothetical protein